MHYYTELNSRKWKLSESEWESAIKLLAKAEKDLGAFPIEVIELPDQQGYRALAFCIPHTLRNWRGRLREIMLDSACKTKSLNMRSPTER
jgi:hypothetical protein